MKKTVSDVVSVLNALKSDKSNKVYLDKNYHLVSRSVKSVSVVSSADKMKYATAIANAKDNAEIVKVSYEAGELAKEKANLKLDRSGECFSVIGLSYNDKRPNVSMTVRIDGTIHLPSDAPAVLPRDFATSTIRSYCVVCDGKLNIPSFKADLTPATVAEMASAGAKLNPLGGDAYEVDLTAVPLHGVDSVSAMEYAELSHELCKCKVRGKVLSHWLASTVKTSSEIEARYGTDASQYLSDLGITDKGFFPKTENKEVKSVYKVLETTLKLAGMSSIPSVNAFLKKNSAIEADIASKGKSRKSLNHLEGLMKNCFDEAEVNSKSMTTGKFIGWLEDEKSANGRRTAEIEDALAEIRLGLAGGLWYDEFTGLKSPVVNVMTSDGFEATITEAEAEIEC